MKHKESQSQIHCVTWFRYEYPELARLLVHPINEGSGHTAKDRIRQGIHKAEGAVAGVSDLLLFLPSGEGDALLFGLGIEMKEEKGRQSQDQKDFEQMFFAAGFAYVVCRGLEEFKALIKGWVDNCPSDILARVKEAHKKLEKQADARAYQQFKNIINPRK